MKKYFLMFAFAFLGMSTSWASGVDYGAASVILESLEAGQSADIPNDLKTLFFYPAFNPTKDVDISRSSQSGFYTRKAFINLSNDQLKDVVSNRLPFFSTPFGFSLIHGWMLRKFNETQTPCDIGNFFSFDNFFLNMIGSMPKSVQNIIKKAWFLARKDIEANRQEYYTHMLYLHSAVSLVKTANPPEISSLNIDTVIVCAHTPKKADLTFYNHDADQFWRYVTVKFAGGINAIADIENVFTKTVGWVISHYDLANSTVFRNVNTNTFDIDTFVEFIIEHVPSLHSDATKKGDETEVDDKRSDKLVKYMQLTLDRIVSIYGKDVATAFIKSRLNDVIRTLSAPGTGRRPGQITIPVALNNAFVTAAGCELRARPRPVGTAVTVSKAATLQKVGPIVLKSGSPAITWTGVMPLSEGNTGTAISRFEHWGVYITPVDWNVADRIIDRMNRDQLADILKTWDTYLDKIKRWTRGDDRSGDQVTKGPEVGNFSHTYLADVRALRHRLLAETGNTAVTDAKTYVRKWKSSFINSFKTNGCRAK